MADMTPITIGADVACTDGVCGKVRRLLIDPRARTVTHLVVNGRQFQGRLVPLNLVDVNATTGQIRLRCTIAEFERLDPATKTAPLEGNDADPDNNYDQFPSRSVASQLLADPPPPARRRGGGTGGVRRGTRAVPAAGRLIPAGQRLQVCDRP
jgi:hypothetical protein